MMSESKRNSEVITLAGGCFWCLQPVFQELRGVEKVEVGYSGGRLANPSYEAVCTDTTGHAEAVQVTFDPSVIPLADILRIFFSVHDPTTLNRQGDRKSTRLNSSHRTISYAVFCLKKKKSESPTILSSNSLFDTFNDQVRSI